MLVNYFKYAFRNLVRAKIFSAINIGGLAVSLTAFILMGLYIEYEFNYDKFNTRAANIYRVVDDKQANGLMQHDASSAAPVAPALLADFPQIKQAARFINTEALVKYNDKLFQERNIFFADASVFNIFSFDLLKGDPNTALKNPNSIVVTRQTADKYFGSTDPVGKVISLDGKSMVVTGIMANVPDNSHISFDFLISMATAQQKGSGYDWMFVNWYSNDFYTYILLPDGYDVLKLTAALKAFEVRHRPAKGTAVHNYSLEKLTDIYLYSNRGNQVGKTGNITTIYVFSAIAVFIILIAAINFINLSTARAAERAKEVGIKKVNGVSRKQLLLQFFIESFLTTFFALIIAVTASSLLLPAFSKFAGKPLMLNLLEPLQIAVFFVLLSVIGLLSGSYPAFILSGFKPVMALKGNLRSSAFSVGIRKGLVVFQFAVSVVLIVSTIVVYNQLTFMQRHDLGFKPSQTMVINFDGDEAVQQQYKYIKAGLLRIPGVKNISASSNIPGDLQSGGWSMDFVKKTGDTIHTELPIYLTDFNFLSQYNIPMLAGRALSEEYPADTVASMIINETALHKLGFNNAEEAIGVKVGMYPSDGRIIGIYKDFHFESLQKTIQPLAIRVIPNKFRVFSLELSTADIQKTIAGVSNLWKKLAPQRPLEYSFLSESFNQQYRSETKFGQLFAVFTMLAIGLACFGLFGLALFSVKQRTKEIGVRKVVGATVVQITGLLSLDFIKLVLIAFIIASPVAWYGMNKWIQSFAYRIHISWWIFILSGSIVLVIAFVTIAYQAVKAAIANPVLSLKSE